MNETHPPQGKLDPESLAIRSRPPRAIRFKRGLMIAIAAVGAVSIVAVTWAALRPSIIRQMATPEEITQPSVRDAGEALAKAPASYGDVPKLGPPLPGDLGRPILEHQQAMASATGPVAGPADQTAAQRREQQLAQLKAARESGILVQGQQVSTTAELPVPGSPAQAPPSEEKLALDFSKDPNAQQRKADFLGAIDPKGDVNPHELVTPASRYTLSAGSIIAASLITGIRSDLAGLVTAQVTENAYDSATGRILLIPQGSRLVGSYDSVVAFGQSRALIAWQRIILPDGSSLRIDNVPATDPAGYAGLADKVDFHTWQLLKGIGVSTVLGVGSQLALSGQGDLVQAIRMSTQDSVARAGDQITQRNLGIQPTITIRPGAPVRLVVHKDLVFAPRWALGE